MARPPRLLHSSCSVLVQKGSHVPRPEDVEVLSEMSGQQPGRRAAHTGSILLTPQENDCLFGYLGKKCLALCSAVVQVYAADRSFSWAKRCCGVACLVKDNTQRSYYIRVLDIKDGSSLFEQELYSSFSFSSPRSYFLSFPGDSSQVGVNFASEEEARRFRSALNDLLGRRQRRAGPSLPLATVDMKNPDINSMRFHNSQHHHQHHHHHHQHQQQHPAPQQQLYQLNNRLVHRKDKKTKSKKKRLTKADIGTPSNFQHIGHVGWDPNTGFDLNNLDPELKNLFDMCGISEAQLKDRETSKVIYEFIEKKGGVEAVKNELRRQAPPPPPTRGGPPPVPPPPPPEEAGEPLLRPHPPEPPLPLPLDPLPPGPAPWGPLPLPLPPRPPEGAKPITITKLLLLPRPSLLPLPPLHPSRAPPPPLPPSPSASPTGTPTPHRARRRRRRGGEVSPAGADPWGCPAEEGGAEPDPDPDPEPRPPGGPRRPAGPDQTGHPAEDCDGAAGLGPRPIGWDRGGADGGDAEEEPSHPLFRRRPRRGGG
ncbi:unnamed protein product [Gadus morhua 'NCC']